MSLTEDEKRYWRGYFKRKAEEEEEKENAKVITALKEELKEVKAELKRQTEIHPAQQEDRSIGILPFLAGCALGIFIA